MVVKTSKAEKKSSYDTKLCSLVDIYSQILIVAVDNVGSNQLQNIRKGLRGESVVLMGKNIVMFSSDVLQRRWRIFKSDLYFPQIRSNKVCRWRLLPPSAVSPSL
ncbi:hypothetical protein CsSME_00003279 [Camellia sinensis var. sinensis]